MTRDEIYDHLAQVYLGKRKDADAKKKRQFNAWLVINVFITGIIFTSAFYGLTAFLNHRAESLQNSIIYSLHNGPITVAYNFRESYQPVQKFSLQIPVMDASKYGKIQFSMRAREEGSPGIVKVIFSNTKNEVASYYIKDVGLDWKNYSIDLSQFEQITDWATLTDLSFVLESWNVEKDKGVILIDDVSFSS